MKVGISSGAEADVADGYWFYERQSLGLGDYFGGIHEIIDGFHRSLSRRFPFGIYYTVEGEFVTVVAILDLRRDPLWIRDLLQDRK